MWVERRGIGRIRGRQRRVVWASGEAHWRAALTCLLTALAVSGAQADPGDADPGFAGFGAGGHQIISGHAFSGMAVQPDGKVLLTVFGAGLNIMRLHADGEKDPAFSGDGLATLVNPAFNVAASCAAVQSDGRIVVAGTAEADPDHFMVARLTADGALDPTFDGDGWATTDFDNDEDHAYKILVQPDGKIVVAGWARVGGDFDFAVARYLPGGALDTGFDGDGRVTIGFGGEDHCFDIALQDDGKLVLAGENFSGNYHFAVARLHPNGSLDTGFSGDGKVLTGSGPIAYGVALQPDGKIVVAGLSLVARYLSNGALDSSFDGDGMLTSSLLEANDVAAQPDGKIVVFGSHHSADGDYEFAFQRLNSNGTADPSFDGNGIRYQDFDLEAGDEGIEMRLLPDGRLLGVGYAGFFADREIGLMRLWPDGNLDSGGQQTLAMGTATFPPGSDEYAYGMAVQPDGRILVAGTAVTASNTESDCVLSRFLPNGLLDGTFGTSGRAAIGIHNLDVARGLALQADGKIILAGYTGAPNTEFFLARFNSNGSLDTSFGLGGMNTLDFFGGADYAHAVGLAPDGKIYVAGSVTNGFNLVFGVARFNANGIIDTSFDADGKQIHTFSGMTGLAADALLVQPDGKVVVGGQANGNFALVRFLTTGALDAAFGTGGATVTDMGGTDAIHSMAWDPSSGRIFVAGGGGAGQDFALARYGSNGVLASCPTHGCSDWQLGKAFVDWGGVETAWALDVRNGRVAVAGCVNGLLGWAHLFTTSSTPTKRTTDFPGVIECEAGGEFFTQGGAGIRLAFSDKVFVTATQNIDGDRNIALTSSQTPSSIVSEVGEDPQTGARAGLRLRPALPNPLVRQSVIAFDLAKAGMVRLRIYDVAGRLVRTLADGAHPAGRHEVVWNGADHAGRRVAAGVYFARLDSGGIHVQRAITVLR